MRLPAFITTVFFLLLLSCTKEVYNDVSGNDAPSDPTVSYEQRDQYIERVYITLMGRKPDASEQSSARGIIDQNPRDSALRYQFVSSLTSTRSAAVKRWDDIRSELLESVDTNYIQQLIWNINQLMQGAPPEQQFLYQAEIDRLERIHYAADSLYFGTYSVRQLHQYAVDNSIYDDINMGTENFVVSVFDHFLYRYPTQYELTSGKRMADGFRDVLFLQSGEGKADFLRIFFSSEAYNEGAVRYVYRNYLFREPESSELQTQRLTFASDDDFASMQARVMSTDEYFFQ